VVYEARPRFSEEGGQSVILQEPSANGNPEETMTATNKIDAIGWLRKQLEQAPDPIREALAEVIMALMNAEADAMCGAGYGERSAERVNQRNGYRTRPWDTRVGTIALDIPKLRHGSYFPSWLLEPRRRSFGHVIDSLPPSAASRARRTIRDSACVGVRRIAS
jgi:hypothetical protein